MKQIILGILIFLTPAWAFAYHPPLEQFFKLYQADRKGKAVELVYLYNRDRNDTELYTQLLPKQEQLKNASEGLGMYYGHELMGTHQIGEKLMHITYLIYHEVAPVRVEFEFYKPQETWFLTGFQVDNQLGQELKELARKDIAGFLVKKDLENLD